MGYIMFILAFIIGYPLFMIAAYVLAKLLFVRIDDDAEVEKLREQTRAIRETRIRFRMKKQKLIHA
jgi:hypothetical protein